MSHYSILPPEPDPEALPDDRRDRVRGLVESGAIPPVDVERLVRTLAAHGGGELSSDLALDLLLNDIVEQACLATGASGAAIALLKDGELVCRATSGTTAPELGTRLDLRYGLSGACVQTGIVQHCGDAETDPRVGSFASRQLGIRSILVLPLLEDSRVQGVFEIFSPRIHAFSERDGQTLQALSRRILQDRQRTALSMSALVEDTSAEAFVGPSDQAPAPIEPPVTEEPPIVPAVASELDELRPLRRAPGSIDLVTGVLAAIVIACGIGLGLLIGWRSGLGTGPSSVSRTLQTKQAKPDLASKTTHSAPVPALNIPAVSGAISKPAVGTTRMTKPTADGGLVVYENGKLIFQMNPTDAAQRKAEHEAEEIVTLAPGDSESRLLHRVDAVLPEEARAAKLQGAVVIDAVVAADGHVQELEVVSGDPLFSQNALDAVAQWRYRPLLAGGKNVPFRTRMTISFTLASK